MADPDNGYLTITEAAKYLYVSPQTLRNYADSGKIKCYFLPGGHRRFTMEDLDEFQNRCSNKNEDIHSQHDCQTSQTRKTTFVFQLRFCQTSQTGKTRKPLSLAKLPNQTPPLPNCIVRFQFSHIYGQARSAQLRILSNFVAKSFFFLVWQNACQTRNLF